MGVAASPLRPRLPLHRLQRQGALRFRAINSCIRLAHSIDGMALWTALDIAAPDGNLHPAQQAMLQCHASQCGFCTPGFVMSLFGMYLAPTLVTACTSLPPEGALRLRPVGAGSAAPAGGGMRQPITRALAQEELSGNLCRCTGYRPILDAAQAMGSLPPVEIDREGLLLKLELLAHAPYASEADFSYKSPRTLADLLKARAANPKAQLVAGCTDVGLSVTKQYREFEEIIDITRVAEMRRIDDHADEIVIGAAVTLADAFAALVRQWPQLRYFASRFAGRQVRNAGTLGGNVANGSPIGDSMPLLIALGARVVLMSERGQREMPLEALYTGYRTNVIAGDEVLAWIRVPKAGSRGSRGSPHPCPLPEGEGVKAGAENRQKPLPESAPSPHWGEGGGEGRLSEFLRIYKISKRYDDDISAVCLAIKLHIDKGVVMRASIGAGGVAATPARAVQTEAALTGQPWTLETVHRAIAVLRAEFSPLSDMRASATYRTEVLGNLLQRYWLESQGMQQIDLATFVLEET